jgi:hypothetical protein
MRGTKAAAYFTTSAAALVVAWVTLAIAARADGRLAVVIFQP